MPSDFKMHLLEHLYHKDCITTRQSWLFSFFVVINNKQDEMKVENIQNKLQSSFILLQFICLSILCYTTIVHRISFKICILMFKCIHGLAPKYLSDLVILPHPHNRTLRSIYLMYSIHVDHELSWYTEDHLDCRDRGCGIVCQGTSLNAKH